MYGITFDLDAHILEDGYNIEHAKAYTIVRNELEKLDFKLFKYGVFLCEKYENDMLIVHDVVNALKKYEWFNAAVKNVYAFKLDAYSDISKAFE